MTQSNIEKCISASKRQSLLACHGQTRSSPLVLQNCTLEREAGR